ncbi:hypothetical protein TNCT_659131 [Trichonephila clavata]|uniref:Uncharacterized protein n=1 Tax=Trichonephila clavata TaxID=2740835 RepID=A0A8X6F989_TRICU|nr:hypothetical protein TNCT_659131 [Trichonephila clavata]
MCCTLNCSLVNTRNDFSKIHTDADRLIFNTEEMELEAKTRLRRGAWKGRTCRYDNRMKYEGTFEKERTNSNEGRSGVVH